MINLFVAAYKDMSIDNYSFSGCFHKSFSKNPIAISMLWFQLEGKNDVCITTSGCCIAGNNTTAKNHMYFVYL
jgi:hypothetical protein